ncbi:DUF3289 family protein [Cronobacter turicensis]|nr:DUF3289 family protein [Cronobacter turicensis]
MGNASFPLVLFCTQRKFNDKSAPDMKSGDLTAEQLQQHFNLNHVSDRVDPYQLRKMTAFSNPQSRFAGIYGAGRGDLLTVDQCATLLFDELRNTAWPFSMYGDCREIINRIFSHMQHEKGADFQDLKLNAALRERILKDTTHNSTLLAIRRIISSGVDYTNKGFPQALTGQFAYTLGKLVLPKFNDLSDRFNGLGITVHDIHATQITLTQLRVEEDGWSATVKYQCQDHFGLDETDIRNPKFNQFLFFRIWFVLQHYHRFGFKPFMTNMEATFNLSEELA